MKNILKEGGKAFGFGFCGCLGAGVASSILIIPLFLILGGVRPPAINDLLQGAQGVLNPTTPFARQEVFQMVPSPESLPTCEELIPGSVIVWLTKEDNPRSEQTTSFSSEQDVYVWVQGPEGCEGAFSIRAATSTGQKVPVSIPNQDLTFDPTGAPVSIGNINQRHEALPFDSFRIEVISGGATVAWIEVTAEAGG